MKKKKRGGVSEKYVEIEADKGGKGEITNLVLLF